MISWAHPSPQPKRRLDRFCRFCTASRDAAYTLQWAAPRLPMGAILHLIYGFLGPPKFSTQTASRPVQLFFLQGSLLWQTNRQTDWQTILFGLQTISHIYIRSTAMRPKTCLARTYVNKSSRKQLFTARAARIASALLAIAIPSVCLSVRLSVTRRYCVKITERT